MANFPAATMMTPVLGLDFHKVIVPPPTPPLPHVFIGPLFLWMTPKWPVLGNVLINLKPAACVGSMGFGPHIPMGAPSPEGATNTAYWKRWLMNAIMAIVLVIGTTLANMAIGFFASFLPKGSSSEAFLKKVTGIQASEKMSAWNVLKSNVQAHMNFTAWIKLLMPPMPYPVGHGSVALGSPGVRVNEGLLGFVCPLAAISCTEFPFIIAPNAMPLGFSNVMVGVSGAAILEQLTVGAAQRGVSGLVGVGVGKGAKAVGLSH
jgi:hypothetical protein